MTQTSFDLDLKRSHSRRSSSLRSKVLWRKGCSCPFEQRMYEILWARYNERKRLNCSKSKRLKQLEYTTYTFVYTKFQFIQIHFLRVHIGSAVRSVASHFSGSCPIFIRLIGAIQKSNHLPLLTHCRWNFSWILKQSSSRELYSTTHALGSQWCTFGYEVQSGPQKTYF